MLKPVTIALLITLTATGPAQQAAKPLAFDVASLRENTSGPPPAGEETYNNIPIGPGDVYTPTGGLLSLRNVPLMLIISFAYRMTAGQQNAFASAAPQWVRDTRYNLQARTEKPDVTKNELREMVRSLLAERFQFAAHYESRTTNVYALQLVHAGSTGPRLRQHTGGTCSRDFRVPEGEAPPPEATADGFPTVCGGLMMLPPSAPGHYTIGAREVPITNISNALPDWGGLGRPVVDQTGLTGMWDFLLDWVPHREPPPNSTAAPGPAIDQEGPDFTEAIQKQLGVKLTGQKQPVEVLVLDHIDHLSEN